MNGEIAKIAEGQLYEAEVSLSGGEGPRRRWIVVAPHGKSHLHSVDDPLELHCWPLLPVLRGLESGRARLVGFEPDHPVVRLQRAKEALAVGDTHCGLKGEGMAKMLELLDRALAEGEPYYPFAAGEVLGLMAELLYTPLEVAAIRARVSDGLERWGARGAVTGGSD